MKHANITVVLKHETGRETTIPHVTHLEHREDNELHVEFRYEDRLTSQAYDALSWSVDEVRHTELYPAGHP